jgi:hypothetical protein
MNNDELWKVSQTPFIIIHLSIFKKQKDKTKKKSEIKKKDEKLDAKADE